MSIYNVTNERLAKVAPSVQSLKPGQIVQGRILKIFPDNKAQIQLGTQKMVAQLEASLTVGEKYYFQVKTTDDMIHLKVLGDHLKGQDQTNIMNLMQQLGLKSSKANAAFMQTLINEKIPFDKMQLGRAFQLLGNSKDTNQTQYILKEMIANKLPVTDSIFQALSAKNSHTFSEQAKALLSQLRQDTAPSQLVERLSQMVKRPLNAGPAIIRQIITETVNNNQQIFNTLKAAGMVNPEIDFTSWKAQWEPFVTLLNSKSNLSNQQLSNIKLPLQLNDRQVIQAFEQIINNRQALLNQSQETIKLWGSNITKAVTNNVPLSGQDFTQLKQQISQTFMPLLTNGQQQQLQSLLQNSPSKLRQLLAFMQTMNTEQIYTKAEQFLTTLHQDRMFLLGTPKEQFLSQVNQTLLFTGLSYENQLANNNLQQESITVKAMLMQLMQQSDGTTQERSQQLLHFINGMQIQSVNETNNFVQASLQIPGERLGLNNDLELEFEGSKMENGEINPDFCRILFYLDLTHLNKTIIDMNIQKRAVSVTIFNDLENMKERMLPLKPMLKEGLKGLNYQLSTVSFKPLQQSATQKKNVPANSVQPSYNGVDYLI